MIFFQKRFLRNLFLLPFLTYKLMILVFEKNIERSERSINACDVLL